MPSKKESNSKEKNLTPKEKIEDIPAEVIEEKIRIIAPQLKEAQVKKVAQMVSYSVKSMIYSGPLPPPEDFKKYEEVLPTAAERILSMTERQSAHRQSIEKIIFPAEIKKSYLGMILGFIMGMTAISYGFVLLLKNKDAAGLSTIIVALVSLVSVFIIGIGRQKQRERKHENLK